MKDMYLMYLFFGTMVLLALQVTFVLLQKNAFIKINGWLIVLSTIITIISLIFVSGHFPSSGDFEKMQNIVLIIVLLGVIFNKRSQDHSKINNWFWIIAFIFQIIPLLSDLKVSENYIIYNRAPIILFFQFRLIAVAMFAFALSNSLAAFQKVNFSSEYNYLMQTNRNFTLLGAAVYLSGEFFGSIWALQGWGDPWRWSKGFFLATIMFLFSMISSHLPGFLYKTSTQRIVFSSLPLLAIILSYIL
jgi:ABC-type transport system involved in cytochrome c biogenesis permease subunit